MPRVSWLVPVFNAAPYLDASLSSVRAQSFSDFEAIIVDDGSTDGSADIIKRLCATDGRFTYVGKTNSGIVDTLNAGLARCRGEFIARMDGDDLCETDRLATQVAYLDEHPNCVVVGSRVTVIDANGIAVRHSTPAQWKQAGPAGFPPRALTLNHPSLVMRANALREAGGYRRGFLAAEDYDLLFRLARLGSISELPDYLLRYRVHAGSESGTKIARQRISCLKAELSAYLQDEGRDDGPLLALSDHATFDDLCALVEKLGPTLPNNAALRSYHAAEFLRRATYRLPRAESNAAAKETAKRLLLLTQHASTATARYFIYFGVKELMRWLAVNVRRRNAPPSSS